MTHTHHHSPPKKQREHTPTPKEEEEKNHRPPVTPTRRRTIHPQRRRHHILSRICSAWPVQRIPVHTVDYIEAQVTIVRRIMLLDEHTPPIAGIVVSLPRQKSYVQTLNSSAGNRRQSKKNFMTTKHPVYCVLGGLYRY
jgi:hypothetical protein